MIKRCVPIILLLLCCVTIRAQGQESAGNSQKTRVQLEIEQQDTTAQKTVPDSLSQDGEGVPDTTNTTGENLTQKKKTALDFDIAGFGPAGFDNLETKDLAYHFYAGRIWEVNEYASMRAIGAITADFDRAFLVELTLGLAVSPFQKEVTPYLGGDLGLAFARSEGDNVFGFTIGGSIGAVLFRSSNVQMNLELRAESLLNEFVDSFPVVYIGRIGILF